MFTNYRKETSERSDHSNWAKKILIEKTEYFFDSIEGCNENKQNVVTHLMERARVDVVDGGQSTLQDVLSAIISLEGSDVLQRKINFARTFQRPLTYVLYCDEKESVWMFTIKSLTDIEYAGSYSSYNAFSDWIASIKGWKSTKPFREREDLPYFDKMLRRAGCAWPTNIDCFITTQNFEPIGILEFQNAKNTEVLKHCNNEFFLGKLAHTNQYGYLVYDNDIRRWLSQEILRIQSGLRLFVVTWAQNSKDFILKEIEVISFPALPFGQDWKRHGEYQKLMHDYANSHNVEVAKNIMRNFSTYKLIYDSPNMLQEFHHPPLSAKDKSFPFIYYRYKNKVKGNAEELPVLFMDLIKSR
ncbi:MAG: hypothetical protein K2G11_08470 [Muribaculaceae bacterium]|nr:hypothetical protein [Muribaculaceae bacterium]